MLKNANAKTSLTDNMKPKLITFGILFTALSFCLIMFALTRPCEVGPITQTQNNQTIEVNQPVEMNRMICLSTDSQALFALLIGSAAAFPAVNGIFRGLTEENKEK